MTSLNNLIKLLLLGELVITIKTLIKFLKHLNKNTVVKVNNEDIVLSYYETSDNKQILNIKFVDLDKLTTIIKND